MFGQFFSFSSSMLCYAILCYAMLYYAILCCATLCYVMLCYATLCDTMLSYTYIYPLKLIESSELSDAHL